MPGFDRTGPRGYGATSGRGMGPCGRGMRYCRGFGRGRGFSFRYTEPAELTKEEQKKIIEAELKDIEAEKQEIEKQLKNYR
ncbi:MAG: DUF5320 domain-containing protein [Candidatus Aenigmatarchaeota archaeon]